MRRFTLLRLLLLLSIVAPFAAGGEAQIPTPRLWGTLRPGPYTVGFQSLDRYDTSRTWKVTRSPGQLDKIDGRGRPVRIQIWYPVEGAAASPAMKYGDYINLPVPENFTDVGAILHQRDMTIAALSAPKEDLETLLSAPVAAHMNAHPAKGRFPLILYFPGLNDSQSLNVFVLAEYLASNGYALASVSLLGPSSDESDQHRSPVDIEATVRDAEFALSILKSEPFIEPIRIGAVGESLGGVEALILAMRNGNVSAVVGLDGTYGFKEATGALTDFYSYAPQHMTAALLDLRKGQFQQQTVLDLSALQDFHFAERLLVTLDHIHHSDFTSFAVVAYQFRFPSTYTPAPGEHSWSRESGYEGYLNVCRIVRDFLDLKMKNQPGAESVLAGDLKNSNALTQSFAAADVPPSPNELVSEIRSKGFNQAKAEIEKITTQVPVSWVVNEATFNSLGYELLNQRKTADAIAAFQLNAAFHPQSANASDSLGDGYAATGDMALAVRSYQHAIELVSKDPAFDATAKKSFALGEKNKIDKLQLRP